MNGSTLPNVLVVVLRILLGWVFLYAGMRQIFFTDAWSAGGFLKGAKTFTDFYAWFAQPAIAPIASFAVKWGHLLIGLSLIAGLLVRVSAPIGALLMLLYYFPRMEFPYVDGPNQFLVEYHLVYAVVLVYLAAVHAGRAWGLDGWIERRPMLVPHTA